MKIHHVVTDFVDTWKNDPQLGPIKARELVMKASDISVISNKDYGDKNNPNGEFGIGPDGTFDVPDGLAQFLLSHKTPSGTWFAGETPFPPKEEPVVPRSKARKPAEA